MSNPFAALIGNSECDTSSEDKSSTTLLIEDIFQFTLNKRKQTKLFYLEEIANGLGTHEFNTEILEHALFERILLISSNENVITYLYECFNRNESCKDNPIKDKIQELILRNVVTAFKQPELYEGQDLFAQMYNVFKESETEAREFFDQTFKTFQNDEDEDAAIATHKALLKAVHKDVASVNPVTFPYHAFTVLNIYSTRKELALVLLDYTKAKNASVGSDYANTLLGALFCVSIMPKTANGSYSFFQGNLDPASIAHTENFMWTSIDRLSKQIHGFVLNLLKCHPDVRTQLLVWIGDCLKANEDRGKLWNSHAPNFNLPDTNTVGDGFMLNLACLLAKLCQPFCSNTKDGKILKVDPTYCAVPNEFLQEKGIHLQDMSKQTCLVPTSENEIRLDAPTYSFITECFYMTHRAFDIGFKTVADKLLHLNQEMSQIERAYQDAFAQNGGRSEVVETLKQRMINEFAKYCSTKCAMSEPNFLQDLFNLLAGSAFWLNSVALTSQTSLPLKEQPVTSFPPSSNIPDTLKCIPEFVIENIVSFLIFLRRFTPRTFEVQGFEGLRPVITFILFYMGPYGYTRNPHLRANLAEALEALLPFHKDEPDGSANNLGGGQRERIFKEHEHRKEIVPILLDVFVSIEMTGQSVQFEQKFNYRRPMYLIMDYLWTLPEYKQYFRKLAEEAERNMEAVSPPIFLRFINLLVNDAIFLLDESLTNMAKLREMETARESGEWNKLPAQERAQNIGLLQHTGNMAKFDNILGRDTIRTLEHLTSHITIVFTHSTMVDRVASMLNYFLLKLVGPDKKNFKVKDQTEYRFDPAATVLDICKIYVSLKDSDSFCLAVSQDGRSYSPQLFTLAEDVLVRIGGGLLLGELQEVAKKVSDKAEEYKSNEEAVAEAPDHFLDPIMSTLMLDPVILPSSKQTVDRSTIARHLLSDQTDPFNRAPLSMDQVVPHVELANEIQQWLNERKAV